VALYYSPDSIDEPLPDSFSKEAVRFTLLKAYRSKASIEEIRGLTLFGPQKDELVIKIGEGKARENASQGQHKSILISLKFAEFHYIKDKSNETPIVLLDDIFSELDERRAEMTLELLSRHNAQILLTTADVKHLVNSLPVGDNSFIFVENGIIITEK
jgi:DNA replication and repair protein RecF